MFNKIPNLRPLARLTLAAFLLAGCAATTVTPRFPATRGLPRPDRVLVYDFSATTGQVEVDRSTGPRPPQSDEEIRVGRELAKALSTSLLNELRNRGIVAHHAGETSPPGETTVSIRGQFMRADPTKRTNEPVVGFGFGAGEVRTHTQVFQGTGLKLSLVGEADAVTPSNLKPGGASGAAIQADAQRIAKEIAERVANYYRREGWIR